MLSESEVQSDLILSAQHLKKSFLNRVVVKDVSITIKKGEAVGLLGPNGAGKTTCFYMMSGLIKPDKGTVKLNNYDISKLPMYQRARLGIGYLPQESSVFKTLTVEDNIKIVLEIVEKSKDKQNHIIDNLFKQFGLEHLRKTTANNLSGGERRKLEIARCLATKPDFILLDEPFAGIDPIAIYEIRYIIAKLKESGIGVLITDHNVRDTLKIVDKAYIIYDGKVLLEGEPDKIINDDEVKKVYLGQNFLF